MTNRFGLPQLGFGVGLRNPHFDTILSTHPPVDWFEIITENFLDSGGWPRYVLRQVAERYPVVMHGVSLSIGSTAPLDFEYLAKVKSLAREIRPAWLSDHLCWTGVLGRTTHDLLPMPFNEESLQHVVARIRTVQDFLELPLMLENPSTYLRFRADTIAEPHFLREVARQADCGLLLDVNNIYVSAFNHGFDASDYLDQIPADRVVQMHLAGHSHCGTHIVDTHDGPVIDPVWELYGAARSRFGVVSTLIEWDSKIPELHILLAEADRARSMEACGVL